MHAKNENKYTKPVLACCPAHTRNFVQSIPCFEWKRGGCDERGERASNFQIKIHIVAQVGFDLKRFEESTLINGESRVCIRHVNQVHFISSEKEFQFR